MSGVVQWRGKTVSPGMGRDGLYHGIREGFKALVGCGCEGEEEWYPEEIFSVSL